MAAPPSGGAPQPGLNQPARGAGGAGAPPPQQQPTGPSTSNPLPPGMFGGTGPMTPVNTGPKTVPAGPGPMSAGQVGAPGPGAPAGPGDTPVNDFQGKADSAWNDIQDLYGGSIQEALASASNQYASETRRANEMGALQGLQAGGGAAATASAQAQLKGQELFTDAILKHKQQGLELLVNQYDSLVAQAEAANDREAAAAIEDKRAEAMYRLELIRQGIIPPGLLSEDELAKLGLGGGAAPSGAADPNDPSNNLGTWEGYRDYGAEKGQYAQYHDITHHHMNKELPAQGHEGDQSMNDIIHDLQNIEFGDWPNTQSIDKWSGLTETQRMQVANWMYGYYIREGKLPSVTTVVDQINQGVITAEGWKGY